MVMVRMIHKNLCCPHHCKVNALSFAFFGVVHLPTLFSVKWMYSNLHSMGLCFCPRHCKVNALSLVFFWVVHCSVKECVLFVIICVCFYVFVLTCHFVLRHMTHSAAPSKNAVSANIKYHRYFH